MNNACGVCMAGDYCPMIDENSIELYPYCDVVIDALIESGRESYRAAWSEYISEFYN